MSAWGVGKVESPLAEMKMPLHVMNHETVRTIIILTLWPGCEEWYTWPISSQMFFFFSLGRWYLAFISFVRGQGVLDLELQKRHEPFKEYLPLILGTLSHHEQCPGVASLGGDVQGLRPALSAERACQSSVLWPQAPEQNCCLHPSNATNGHSQWQLSKSIAQPNLAQILDHKITRYNKLVVVLSC